VRLIWMTQAGVVVAGHVIALLLAHAIAIRAGQSTRRAALAQAPLALFMVAYTVFGLWLLATPRGA
jgi:mannose/fructose/N-acetylgalactosamine-specific phosphotransferase system component IIC